MRKSPEVEIPFRERASHALGRACLVTAVVSLAVRRTLSALKPEPKDYLGDGIEG